MLALIALLTAPALAQDLDADGYSVPYDCDDLDATVYPGAPELCDGRDNDCDGTVEDLTTDTDGDGVPDDCDADADGDGVPAGQDCDDTDPTVTTICGDADNDGYSSDDCDDNDSSIYPGAPEACDGVDSDCDGVAEDLSSDFDADGVPDDCDDDADNDTVLEHEDCDDLDPSVGLCDSGIDTGFVDQDGDGYGYDDCDDTDPSIHPGAPELCDGIDGDCDGIAEDLVDADGDGIVDDCIDGDQDGILASEDCDDNDASVGEECRDVDQDGDGWGADEDCDDANPDIHPGMVELCDGLDNDCDGQVDEGFVNDWYVDDDADGYGTGAPIVTCDPAPGLTDQDGDCDDSDASVSPGAIEVCGNGVDEDCDGADASCDTGTPQDDLDGDGYGADDCDDLDASVNPGATDLCGNGIDEDCDGVDEDCGTDPTTTDPGTTDTGEEEDKGSGCSTAGSACTGTGGTYSLLLLPLGLWRRRKA